MSVRKKQERGAYENKVRRAVRARLVRGDRDRVAAAAGHFGPWVSGWMKGRQDATLDEICAMAIALKFSLARVLDTPDEADDLDWQVFGLMLRLKTPRQKQLARELVSSLVADVTAAADEAPDAAPAQTESPRKRHARTTRTVHQAG